MLSKNNPTLKEIKFLSSLDDNLKCIAVEKFDVIFSSVVFADITLSNNSVLGEIER